MVLEGKISVVTGAGQGIGYAIAAALVREGAKVVVADLDPVRAEKAAVDLSTHDGDTLAVKVDISQATDIAAMVETVLSKYGRIDIFVNNAGLMSLGAAIDIPEAEWQRVFDVNVKGTLLCCQAAARAMIPTGGGRIINIASVSAHVAVPEGTTYVTSKAAVVAMTRVMAVEWAKYNILVNSISPGAMNTEMTLAARKADPQAFATRDRNIPIQRPANPDDVGRTVLFFAGENSSYITGRDIIVDGGFTCLDPGAIV